MPITPYTAPLQYEYKPLNLMAFAAPLSKMQEEFDITTNAVETSDFDLEHLPYGTDKEKAKALIETVEGKRDELAKNLAETKNYKQAAIKLKQLNQLWKEDPEAVALKSNYALFSKLDEEEKKRMNSGEISRNDYYQWRAGTIRDYEQSGGADFRAGYDNPQGTYNPIGRQGRLKDLEKELEELSWKVASNLNAKKSDAFRAAGIDPTTLDAKFVKTVMESLTPQDAANKISAYLRTLPRFREWGQEVAGYNYEEIKANNPEGHKELAASLYTNLLESADAKIAQIQKSAKKKPELLQNPEYLKLLEYKEKATLGLQTGEFDDNLVKDLYTQDHLNSMYDMGAVGQVVEVDNVTHDYTFRDMPDEDGGGAGGIFGGSGGFMMPDTEEKWSIDNITKLKAQYGKNIWNWNKKINGLVDGNVRAAIMGDPSSKQYQKLLDDPSLVRSRQVQLMEALSETLGGKKTWQQFQKEAADRGIQIGEGRARAIWGSLSKNNNQGIADYQSFLESSASDNEQYVNVKGVYQNINENVIKNGDYQHSLGMMANMPINELMQYTPNDWANQTASGAGGMGFLTPEKKAEIKKQLWLYDKRNYSEEQLKKAGIPKSGENYLTLAQLAKIKGYKNIDEAITSGYDFGGINVESGRSITQEVNHLRQKVYNSSTERTEMGYRYVGNQKLDNEMSKYFLSSGELTSYVPAYSKDWSNQPGFTAEGKMAPGTKLNISANRAPKLIFHGNQLLYEVPIIIIDEETGKPKETTVKLRPKAGMNVHHDQILRALDEASSGGTEQDMQTNSMVKAGRFDLAFQGNPLSPQYVQSPTVTKGGTGVNLYTIPVDNGAKIQVEKRWREGGSYPVLMIKQINNDGTSSYVPNPSTGKDWYINADANEASYAVKNVIMQMLEGQ